MLLIVTAQASQHAQRGADAHQKRQHVDLHVHRSVLIVSPADRSVFNRTSLVSAFVAADKRIAVLSHFQREVR